MKLKFLIVIVSIVFASCKIQNVEFRGLKSVNPQSFSTETIVVDAVASLHNPNAFGFRVESSDIDIFYENEKVGVAKIRKFKIKRKTENDYIITVEGIVLPVFYKKVSFQSLLMGKKVKLRMEGYVKAKKFIFRKKLELKIEKEVSLSDFINN